MGYIIQYNPEDSNRYPTCITKKNKIVRQILLGALCAVLIIIAAKHKDILLQWLLPGDSAVTVEAFRTLVSDIQQGVTGRKAVTAFCMEIIANGAG